MGIRRLLGSLVVLALVVPEPVLVARLSATPSEQAQDDKAERERKKNADKASQNEAEQAKAYNQTMKEVQSELDELAASLLDARYADPFLQDYVNELGQSLIPKETKAGTLFSFRVLDNAEPNAFALPDGRIYVNTGLLLFAQNEAQLAVVLGHEIAHVTEGHYVESVRAQKRETLIGGVVGAISGGVLGGIFGGKKGAAAGAVAGGVAGVVVAKIRLNSYGRKQEDEADQVGTRLALDRRYDARESIAFFRKLSDTYGEVGRFANALYGRHSRNTERMAYIDQLLTGELAPTYNKLRSAGSLTNGTGEMNMYASRMIRDVAIDLMENYNQYGIAKEQLERIADYRASDPKTLWALGKVLKLVGRTPEDRNRALDYLQRAAQLDERNIYPFTHRELGLMQARLGSTPAAVESLKKYVLNYVSRNAAYPDDLLEIYDYLLTFGDRQWTAPVVDTMLVRAISPGKAGPKADEPTASQLQSPAKSLTPRPDAKKPEVKRPKATRPGGGGGQ